jgi:hypothetical protein
MQSYGGRYLDLAPALQSNEAFGSDHDPPGCLSLRLRRAPFSGRDKAVNPPLNHAGCDQSAGPLSRSSSELIRSIGMGKMMVEFLSPAIVVSVCR